MPSTLRILVVGCGHMGTSHARAYHAMSADFEIVGLVARNPASRQKLNAEFGGRYAEFADYADALARTKPDAVCISTYPDTHAAYATAALEAGAHVFLEKPVADNIADCERVVATARKHGRKLVVGYILHVHPSWKKFTELAQTLGKPLVMRMNLNQQSSGANWATHKNLLRSTSPIVDCGVHYVDVMCRMTGARPVSVNGIGARLSDEIAPNQINYGHLQVTFSDGSVGWYEAGWGPMMSETAFFVKDVIGPKGCVSIVAKTAASAGNSADVDSHSKTESLRLHHATVGADGKFSRPDEIIDVTDEPNHDELCRREQDVFLDAIRHDRDLTAHWDSAIDSLRIVLAADQSFREGRTIKL
ncbi:Gfo/Idh/MocA family protein [Horticoccus sp. 23ND18S-11]|uniref:Gfo/Idh/MocA family protein n=1 Tax=Horticoccus sp. 23ND18S-11 TaxID=3391832 RepID=UPI0039C8D3E2